MISGHSTTKKAVTMVLCVVMLQWCLLPSCPCQLAALFGFSSPSSESDSARGEREPSLTAAYDGGDGAICHCDEPQPDAVCGSHSEHRLKPFAVPANDSVVPRIPADHASGFRHLASGNDPPHSGGMRLHLRWQVMLI
jgi:hypothetical protein